MLGVCFAPCAEVEVLTRATSTPIQRRETVEERLLQVTRDHGVFPRQLFRRALMAVGTDRAVVSVSEVNSLQHQVKEL